MQEKVKDRLEVGVAAFGLLVFGALLVVDVARDGHAAWIVFDTAMMALFLADLLDRFALAGHEAQGIVKVGTNVVVGSVLAVTFTFFAFGATNLMQVLLAAFIAVTGAFLAVATAKRIRISRGQR